MEDREKRIIVVIILLNIIPIGTWGIYYYLVREFPVEAIFSGPENIEGLNGTWYISGPYSFKDNVSYAVTFQSVVFRFLSYRPPVALDVGTGISISVTYNDSTVEYIDFGVGGYVPHAPQFHIGNHTDPSVVIITHRTESNTDWYSWYYAISAES